MATITNTLTITSPAGDALSDTLSLSLTKADNAINGDVEMKLVTVSNRFSASQDGNTVLLAARTDTPKRCLVYLKNNGSTGEVISIFTDTGDDRTLVEATEKIMTLKSGDFALFPWAGEHTLFGSSASGSPKLEVGVFEEA
jgi:hypothetical protein